MGQYKVKKRRSIAGVMRNIGEVIDLPEAYTERFVKEGSIELIEAPKAKETPKAQAQKASEESK